MPLLCIPDGRDQPDNAARVVAAGAGMRVGRHVPPHKLRRVISRALQDPALKHGAKTIAGALARSDGALTIADAIERLASRSSTADSADSAD